MFQKHGCWPLQLISKYLGAHRDYNSQSGSSLRSVRVHSLTLSCTPGSMRCGSRNPLSAHTLASPCLGCKPKVRVTTYNTLCFIGYDTCAYIAPMPHTHPKKLMTWQRNICKSDLSNLQISTSKCLWLEGML
jgi:hypothetical protein